MNYLLVFVGGGFGAVCRYLVSSYFTRLNITIPVGTIAINIIGSFLIGLVLSVIGKDSDTLKIFLTIGFLGGFTTFSTFSMDTLKLIETGNIFLAVINVVLSVVAGLFAVYLGYKIGV